MSEENGESSAAVNAETVAKTAAKIAKDARENFNIVNYFARSRNPNPHIGRLQSDGSGWRLDFPPV